MTTEMEITRLLKRLDECPPFLVYYGSGYKTGLRPDIESIAVRCGLSYRTVARLSGKTSWTGIKIEVVSKFCEACGVDPLNFGDMLEWLVGQMQNPETFLSLDPNRGRRSIMMRRFNRLASWYEISAAKASK